MDSKPAGSGRSSETARNATSPDRATLASASFRRRETFQSMAEKSKIPPAIVNATIPIAILRLDVVPVSTVITILELHGEFQTILIDDLDRLPAAGVYCVTQARVHPARGQHPSIFSRAWAGVTRGAMRLPDPSWR